MQRACQHTRVVVSALRHTRATRIFATASQCSHMPPIIGIGQHRAHLLTCCWSIARIARVAANEFQKLSPMEERQIDEAKTQVQGQLAAQYIQDVMQKITDKCFTRCVIKPGARLDDTEKMCTAKCMDRYLDAMALVSQAWAVRAKQQASMQGGGGGFE